MKGVITAGGKGTRLYPLTYVTNKHLLPVYNKPMIYYPLATLINAGVTDVLIVTSPEHSGHFINLLGSGRHFGANISYAVQEQPGGIAQVVGMAEDFAAGEEVMVILGDNIFEDQAAIIEAVASFKQNPVGSKIFLKQVNDANRYGVAEVQGDQIINIEEKPQQPKSDLAVTGLYLYDNTVFEIIKSLKPSGRGELEITDVNNAYIQRHQMTFQTLQGNWTDSGTFDALLESNNAVANKIAGGAPEYWPFNNQPSDRGY